MSEEIITMQESARLVELERTIETGMTTFVEVGSALMEIRDSRLYRVEYKTFEAYCRDKWGMSKTQANRLISSSGAAQNLAPMGVIPLSERQARPLTTLPPEQQPEAWERAVEIAEGEQPTARQVEQAAREILSPEEPALTKKTRGSFTDWQAFRQLCLEIASLCDSLEALKVDAAHAIQARDLSARLAKKLTQISNTQ
jgi:hypothetical protein